MRSIMGQLHYHQSRALLNADAAVRKGEERCAGRWRCAGPKRHASGPAARHGAVGRADGRRRDSDLIRPGSLGGCPLAPRPPSPNRRLGGSHPSRCLAPEVKTVRAGGAGAGARLEKPAPEGAVWD